MWGGVCGSVQIEVGGQVADKGMQINTCGHPKLSYAENTCGHPKLSSKVTIGHAMYL